MARLIVTADVHGSYSTWSTIKNLMEPDDTLAVAGDLFSTGYPFYGSPDFQPDVIKKELAHFDHPFYYVYGNCDKASFSPGYMESILFDYMGYSIYLHHGHRPLKGVPFNSGIVIQGHTHVSGIKTLDGIIFLNPGSLAAPRDGLYTYAVMDGSEIAIVNIKTGETTVSLML
ncbi:MAG: metallophosphoesterase family protein [Desulfamplus sp.]|nr:metallophosphoesterase family protein [Desulfamplus sp.]